MTNESLDTNVQLLELQIGLLMDRGIDIPSRTVQLFDEIDEKTFRWLDCALTLLENHNRKSIKIKINSPGGSVYDALAIIGRMRNSPCRIVTEGYGAIMSAATLILAAGAKRRISEHALFMWHEHSYDTGGRHSEVKAWVQQFDKEEAQWSQLMAKFSNKPATFWTEIGKHTDKFFNAHELLAAGVIDEIF